MIELMRAVDMPNGLSALGFTEHDLDALATGAEPQYRVIKTVRWMSGGRRFGGCITGR